VLRQDLGHAPHSLSPGGSSCLKKGDGAAFVVAGVLLELGPCVLVCV